MTVSNLNHVSPSTTNTIIIAFLCTVIIRGQFLYNIVLQYMQLRLKTLSLYCVKDIESRKDINKKYVVVHSSGIQY